MNKQDIKEKKIKDYMPNWYVLKVYCLYGDFVIEVSNANKDLFEEVSRMQSCPKCSRQNLIKTNL